MDQPTSDQQKRFLFEQADIRGEVVQLENTFQAAVSGRGFPERIELLLGEFLAAASLLASTLKFDGILSIQARGEGIVKLLVAECTNQKELRAVVRLEEDADTSNLNGLSFKELIGSNGVISIIIEPQDGERYQGIVPVEYPTLAACLEHYFFQSEQLNTKLWFAADKHRCAGLLIQALPKQLNASSDTNEEYWETVVHLASTVKDVELLELGQDQLLYRLFNEFEVRTFDSTSVSFNCNCSKERSANALISLGEKDVFDLLDEQETITIDCQFCLSHYEFTRDDAKILFNKEKHTLH